MCNTMEETMTVLRESGVRVTPQRRVILECLANIRKFVKIAAAVIVNYMGIVCSSK